MVQIILEAEEEVLVVLVVPAQELLQQVPAELE
jgi:hypothetical protein